MVLNLQTPVASRSEACQAEKAESEKKKGEPNRNGGNCFGFNILTSL